MTCVGDGHPDLDLLAGLSNAVSVAVERIDHIVRHIHRIWSIGDYGKSRYPNGIVGIGECKLKLNSVLIRDVQSGLYHIVTCGIGRIVGGYGAVACAICNNRDIRVGGREDSIDIIGILVAVVPCKNGKVDRFTSIKHAIAVALRIVQLIANKPDISAL